ncbi:MAG: hypothetical protein EBR01_14140, partial [Proteobacteria bacterium]|nr:hypothetical protein [Pseudomonadota bacterium]
HLNADILGKDFQFISPFWRSSSRQEFIDKFQKTSIYQETSLSKILSFDPIIKFKGLDNEHFAIILQYHTKNKNSVFEAVLGKITNGHLVELRTIYDLAETKKALQL